MNTLDRFWRQFKEMRRRRVLRLLRRQARRLYKPLNRLSIPLELRNYLAPQVRHLAVDLAAIRQRPDASMPYAAWVTYVGAVLVSYLLPGLYLTKPTLHLAGKTGWNLVAPFLGAPYAKAFGIGFIGGMPITVLLLFIFIDRVRSKKDRRRVGYVIRILFFLFAGASAIAAMLAVGVGRFVPSTASYYALAFNTAVFLSVIEIAMGAWLLGFFVLVLYLVRQERVSCPDAVVVLNLLFLNIAIQNSSLRSLGSRRKRRLLSVLEETATCLQFFLPRQLRTGSYEIDDWYTASSVEMATAVRALEKWVLTPKPDTIQHLRDRLLECFTAAASGAWDNFPREVPLRLSRRESLSKAARKVGGTVVLVLAPVPLVIVAAKSGMPSELVNYLKLGVLIWAVITVLARADPAYAGKLATIKDLLAPGKRGS